MQKECIIHAGEKFAKHLSLGFLHYDFCSTLVNLWFWLQLKVSLVKIERFKIRVVETMEYLPHEVKVRSGEGAPRLETAQQNKKLLQAMGEKCGSAFFCALMLLACGCAKFQITLNKI